MFSSVGALSGWVTFVIADLNLVFKTLSCVMSFFLLQSTVLLCSITSSLRKKKKTFSFQLSSPKKLFLLFFFSFYLTGLSEEFLK